MLLTKLFPNLKSTRAMRFSSFPHVDFCGKETIQNAKIGLLGILEDRNSSFQQGTAKAPPIIREFFHSPANNSTSELGLDLYCIPPAPGSSAIIDFGDVRFNSPDSIEMFASVKPTIESIINTHNLVPLTLGGDHSISFPVTRAIRNALQKPFVIVHFDAHPDIYPDFEGNEASHASPFARICESGHVDPIHTICTKLISIGIRTATAIQQQQINKYNVSVIEAKDFPSKGSEIKSFLQQHIPSKDTLVYISFDLDALDPSCAPGVSHREPGGLTTRQAIDAIHAIPGTIIGADIVEYNPLRDVDSITANVAAKLLKEIASKIILSRRQGSIHLSR